MKYISLNMRMKMKKIIDLII